MWFIQEHKNLNLRKQFCLKGKGYLAAVLRWRDTTLCLCLLSTVSFNAPFGQSLQPVSPPLPPLFTPKCPTQNLTPDSQICYSVSGARANNSACVNIRNLLIAGSHPSLRSVSSLNTIFINISSRPDSPGPLRVSQIKERVEASFLLLLPDAAGEDNWLHGGHAPP